MEREKLSAHRDMKLGRHPLLEFFNQYLFSENAFFSGAVDSPILITGLTNEMVNSSSVEGES